MSKVSKLTCGILAGLAVVLLAVVIRLSVINAGLTERNGKMEEYGVRLESMYDKAYFELTDSIRNMQSNLSKLTVSSGRTMQQSLLAEIIGQADSAQTVDIFLSGRRAKRARNSCSILWESSLFRQI